MNRPYVIPYFIPHLGCPHQCLFCDQRSITGTVADLQRIKDDICATIDRWLCWRSRQRGETHFSFYGGSFTCLPRKLQEEMLAPVATYLERGDIDLIRLSTRPDCVDDEICSLLKSHGVGVVELGVQSLDDRVLLLARRGHDAAYCARAVRCLKRADFTVGLQLMPGLPGENGASFRRSVQAAIALGPDLVRLYPALVIAKSGLAELYERGDYRPLSLEKAVVLVCWAKQRFEEEGVKVVRMGLQPSPSLEEHLVAGPYHPSFGELVISRQWLQRVRRLFAAHPGRNISFRLAEKDLSSFNGLKRKNRERFGRLGLSDRMDVIVDRTLEKGSWSYVVC